jgi:hypothetical protein
LTASSSSRIRRFVAAAVLLASVAVPSLLPGSALAYSGCDEPILRSGADWVVPLFDGDCARYAGTFRPSSETLSDSSRAERFEVVMLDANCLQADISSNDFSPDVYVYDDANFSHEVGSWRHSANQASSVVHMSTASLNANPVLYVLATSYGPGARFGKYTLDLRTC